MHGPVRRMRGNRLRRVFRCTLTDASVGDGVPDGPHRRTFEYWRTLVYPSVGAGVPDGPFTEVLVALS